MSSGEIDIFTILRERSERKREERIKLLESIGVKEYFADGNIIINSRICEGVECKLCIEACPTNALYWGYGEVKVSEELCIYCAACVLNCIVDGCIKVTRRRSDGRVEVFSNPGEVIKTMRKINSQKLNGIINRRFRSIEEYAERNLARKILWWVGGY